MHTLICVCMCVCACVSVCRYNDPGTLPPFRRNEVLIQLQGPFELWRPGELEALTSTAVKETTSSA